MHRIASKQDITLARGFATIIIAHDDDAMYVCVQHVVADWPKQPYNVGLAL